MKHQLISDKSSHFIPSKVFTLYPQSSHFMSSKFPLYVPKLPLYTHKVPTLYPQNSHFTNQKVPLYTSKVPTLYPQRSHFIPPKFSLYTPKVPTLYPQSSHCIPPKFQLYTPKVPTLYPQSSHFIPPKSHFIPKFFRCFRRVRNGLLAWNELKSFKKIIFSFLFITEIRYSRMEEMGQGIQEWTK